MRTSGKTPSDICPSLPPTPHKTTPHPTSTIAKTLKLSYSFEFFDVRYTNGFSAVKTHFSIKWRIMAKGLKMPSLHPHPRFHPTNTPSSTSSSPASALSLSSFPPTPAKTSTSTSPSSSSSSPPSGPSKQHGPQPGVSSANTA